MWGPRKRKFDPPNRHIAELKRLTRLLLRGKIKVKELEIILITMGVPPELARPGREAQKIKLEVFR